MQLNIFSKAAKRVMKMTDKAKAELEERQENSKKHKNDGRNEDTTAPKKARAAPQSGNNEDNNSVPSSRTSASPLRRQVTIEDIPDEDDTFDVRSGSGNITSDDEFSESRPIAGGAGRINARRQTPTPEPEPESPDDELSRLKIQTITIVSSRRPCRTPDEGMDLTSLCILRANA
jgi:hypothetical protein